MISFQVYYYHFFLNFKKPLLLWTIYSIYKSRENIPTSPCLASKIEHIYGLSCFIYEPYSLCHLPFPRSVQFNSVQSHNLLQLCDTMNCSTPVLPVHHHIPVYSNSQSEMPSNHLIFCRSLLLNLSQHQGLFQ